MRVISGKLKGKQLFLMDSSITRPLKDIVRESIFNVMLHSNLINLSIENSTVLDLYSGTGSFGIECISRGAKKVTFVENNKQAVEILDKNLEKLSIKNKASLFPQKIESFLSQASKDNKFDIIFFDPPFTEKKFTNELKTIKKLKIFNKTNLIIIHRDAKKAENFDGMLKVIITKKYGRSKIIFGMI